MSLRCHVVEVFAWLIVPEGLGEGLPESALDTPEEPLPLMLPLLSILDTSCLGPVKDVLTLSCSKECSSSPEGPS